MRIKPMGLNHEAIVEESNSFIQSPIESQNWQALQIFSLFRFILASTFFILSKFDLGLTFVNITNKTWFMTITEVYLALSFLSLIGCVFKKPDFDLQVNLPIFFDILAITLLMHMSGGLLNGIGLLLIVIVAAHSLLAQSLLALCGASIASCAILTEQVYIHFTHSKIPTAYSQAGMLGLSIFAIALVAIWLKRRLQNMQHLAYTRGLKLATSLQLNAQVIAFMQEGVVVFDNNFNIQLINGAACRLLGIPISQPMQHLMDLPVRFQAAFEAWKQQQSEEIFQIQKNTPEIRISGSVLSPSGTVMGTVIFIHDISKESQKAQHLKLALLGSLAANIAHEIRNPLSSVSHAAQLLNETYREDKENQSLVNIIKDNCDRMNIVIKNVLTISKKQNARPELINLNSFLKKFIEDLQPPGLPHVEINLSCFTKELFVFIDPTQLHQMLVNLCENGLRYSMRYYNKPRLDIILEENLDLGEVEIHIIDFGHGIDGRDVKHVFEPFYTTEPHGSGLGLYITKELCQMNGGEIHYQQAPTGGSDFSMTLPLYQETKQYDIVR
ncbi:MAG TPA: ATP-binding protein [Gammaproteobacteria bacterium]|nr:ATP-binding protein [Gammaproteobacteria bacterium]